MKMLWKFLYYARLIYWRLRRPVILGAFAIVRRGEQVLLIRHTYQSGWFLPGGGLNKGETFLQALKRELREECGVDAHAPRLQNIYLNGVTGAVDHVAVYVVDSFSGEPFAADKNEVAEAKFFKLSEIPASTKRGHLERILESFGQREISERW